MISEREAHKKNPEEQNGWRCEELRRTDIIFRAWKGKGIILISSGGKKSQGHRGPKWVQNRVPIPRIGTKHFVGPRIPGSRGVGW